MILNLKKYLYSFLILVTIFLSACGDFVRDEKYTRDVIIYYGDIGFDSILTDYQTYRGEDTLETDLGEERDAPSLMDIDQDSVGQNGIFILEDIFEDTDNPILKDIIEESLSQDIPPSDSADIYAEIGFNDLAVESVIDTGTDISCDCDAGSWCGRCYYPGTEGLTNKALKDKLNQLISNHTALGYDLARTKMFSEIDNKDGWVECVYTGFKLQTSGIPNSNIMNTEHTWPQSMGADSEPARSDLFHLFPTKSEANSKRGNYPFGTVVNVIWSEGGSKLGTNSKGKTVFEPRDVHKGNVARAMFYFSVRYKLPIDSDQESELRKWHKIDPVDTEEINRCNAITSYQKNRNPFVDWPPFVDSIEDF